MCGSLHLLSNKLLPGTTSLPISYNGILIDTHLKTPLQHQCKGWRQVWGDRKVKPSVCLHGRLCLCAGQVQLMVEGTRMENVRKREDTGDIY